MIDLSTKSVLFFDSAAGYTHMAEAVVGDFGSVKVYSPWDKSFPSVRDYIPATGLDGIERVYDFFDALDDADLIVFTDVGNGGLQEWLRRQGKLVFGSGYAERLERDRWYLKSVCQRYEIGCAEAMPVTGIQNLREVLRNLDDAHVKMSIFRGDSETFHHEDQADTNRRLNELELKQEPYSDLTEFVVEQPIGGKCVEVGADLPVNVAGIYPRDSMWGYELKDQAYVGRVGALPERLKTVVDKLAPVLQQFDYRGAMSEETRETSEGSYLLDFTARFPNPPSALQRFMINNWAEIMWEGSQGHVVEPEWNAPIGVEILLRSDYGADNPLRITAARWDRTVAYGHCCYNGADYAVSPSQIPEIGAACGMASTLEQAFAEAFDTAEGVKGREIGWDAGALQELTEVIQKGQELGINWE